MPSVFAYPVRLVPEEDGSLQAVFRDIPEILTWGKDAADALAQASDALEVVLCVFRERGMEDPPASPPQPGEHMVSPSALGSVKLLLVAAWQQSGVSKVELAARMGIAESEVRRILGFTHRTKLDRLEETAWALGKRVVIGMEDAGERQDHGVSSGSGGSGRMPG